ncbi:MAG: sodium:solute symporter [Gemmatimonadota bacterium]
MTAFDWSIVFVYMLGLIAFSYLLSRTQKDQRDYYLGGQTMGWGSVGLSTMATQLGAISFISAPAFVGLRENGGIKWLSYEFGVPLAMIFLIGFVVPPLYRAGVVSIYEYLERRFAGSTRVLVSLAFQVSRSLATGVSIYALALVLSVALGVPVWVTILITGGVTVVYDMLGGMKAVVYSDVIQMAVLFIGILLCSGFAFHLVGGWDGLLAGVEVDRLRAVNFSDWGLGEGSEFGFWPMVIGGFFLYASFYGCDQLQAQRYLSCKDERGARATLLFNGLGRFPVVLLYCLMGLLLGTFAVQDPRFLSLMPSQNPDLMVPTFIIHYLPAGLTGLLIVGILAAAMSSLDSALNSLSAASMQDLVIRNVKRPLTDRENLLYSKLLTLFWGIFCSVAAFVAGDISPTVIEAINLLGSLFYGPILMTFALAILTRKTTSLGANLGLLAGVSLNFSLWIFAGDIVFWFWWNFTGAAATLLVGYGVSLLLPAPVPSEAPAEAREAVGLRPKETAFLLSFFVGILALSATLIHLFRALVA